MVNRTFKQKVQFIFNNIMVTNLKNLKNLGIPSLLPVFLRIDKEHILSKLILRLDSLDLIFTRYGSMLKIQR